MPEGQIRIRHKETDEDVRQMAWVTAQAFEMESPWFFWDALERANYRPELSRILTVDGEIASCFQVVAADLRIGSSSLRLAGIGAVATHPEHRRKGYAALLLQDAMNFLENEGFDLSMLFGINDFYHRFGYIPALNECVLKMEVDDAAHVGKSGRSRPYVPEDFPTLKRFYEESASLLPGAIERPDAIWPYVLKHLSHLKLIENEQGEALGYADISQAKDDSIAVQEIGTSPSWKTWEAVLSVCVREAQEQQAKNIRFNLSPDHPFSDFCRSFGTRSEVYSFRSGGGMMRLHNLRSTLEKMLSTFSLRLRNSALQGRSGAFVLRCEQDTMGIIFEGGEISLSEPGEGWPALCLPQQYLAQLLIGYQPVEYIARCPEVSIPQETREILKVLFPRGCPYIWEADRF